MRLVLLILACVCNTLFRYTPFCFQFGIPEENHTSYAVGQALSYLLLLGYIYQKNWYRCRLYRIVFFCAFSNFIDELFFNPLEFSWNEKVFIVFVVVFELFVYKLLPGYGPKESVS